MENAVFSLAQSNINGIEGSYDPIESYDIDVAMEGIEDWGEIYSLSSENGNSAQQKMTEKEVLLSKDEQPQPHLQQHQQPISNYCSFDDFDLDAVSSPTQAIQESRKLEKIDSRVSDCIEPKEQRAYPFSLKSLGLLNSYGSRLKKLNQRKLSNLSIETNMGSTRKLSTVEIIKAAGARHIEFSDQRDVDFPMLMHRFSFAHLGLSEEETQDVELAHLLLAAAEKVGKQQFDRAIVLITHCEWIASNTGNSVQRIVFHFSKALQERIDRETGRINIVPKGLEEKGRRNELCSHLGCTLNLLAFHQELPFIQVTQFTGIQAIIENVSSAKKIHLIDLGIRCGVHWTALMQALTEREERFIEELKITAFGTAGKEKMEEAGKRLEIFAESMNLKFSFKVVYVSNMKDLKAEHFEIENGEVVAVYAPFVLKTMISRPSHLETLMGVIKKLNPSIMVVIEVEADHNSPSFINRFIDALFFYGALFDCMEAFMDRKSENRIIIEAILGESIRNIAAREGEERDTRHVKMDVWRAFFARFGMVEMEFSESSLYQASLVLKQFGCGKSCFLHSDGKSLIVGWKGTPVHSLSAWKFY